MGRADKTVALNVRVTEGQADRLRRDAEERFSGNISAAARRALTDAELLRIAREDCKRLVEEQGLRLPRNADDGTTTALELILLPLGGVEFEERL